MTRKTMKKPRTRTRAKCMPLRAKVLCSGVALMAVEHGSETVRNLGNVSGILYWSGLQLGTTQMTPQHAQAMRKRQQREYEARRHEIVNTPLPS